MVRDCQKKTLYLYSGTHETSLKISLWQLCVLNGDISVAARNDAAEPPELKHTSMHYGLCAASCKCCEACGCHFVGV